MHPSFSPEGVSQIYTTPLANLIARHHFTPIEFGQGDNRPSWMTTVDGIFLSNAVFS
jgi:hypothetical protein